MNLITFSAVMRPRAIKCRSFSFSTASLRKACAFCPRCHLLSAPLAMMLQKFRFTVVPGARIDRVVRITMNPRYGMPMLLRENDRRYESNEVRGQIHEMVKLPGKAE